MHGTVCYNKQEMLHCCGMGRQDQTEATKRERRQNRTMIFLSFAPMEGLTDSVYRRVHHECFPGTDLYYLPFISPTQHHRLTTREARELDPKSNTGVPCVPQVLTKDPELCLWFAKLAEDLGYREININAGCPSATVTAKGKGAGLLRNPDALRKFLDGVLTKSPLPVSVKTRIGYQSAEEWLDLLQIYNTYPLKKLIVHARTCGERYDPGTVHWECLKETARNCRHELVINGDLFTADDIHRVTAELPGVSGVMLGRGLVANPGLIREVREQIAVTKKEITFFHDRLVEEYMKVYDPYVVFMKLRVVMKHMICCFDVDYREDRHLRKSGSLRELLEIDRTLFRDHELKAAPAFLPDPPQRLLQSWTENDTERSWKERFE